MLNAGLVLVAAALVAVTPRLPRLRQRYDSNALAPITDKPDAEPGDENLKRRLMAWVMDDAGNGATLLPWSHPTVPCVLSCATVPADARLTVRHFGYRLAGYHQLDERSRLGGILYRLGVQLRPLIWFLPRRTDEPWDDAWLEAADETRIKALARWQPRRPTLIVLDHPAAGLAARVAGALGCAAKSANQPIRLLILGPVSADELATFTKPPLALNGARQRNG
ncbi:MAG: hypothetical protein RBS05_15595 [Zoogloea oleivorans]|jgi:hypothetical protein|uniref:hypothetical protein n=1 Tax=Zoogloea oleivorans TaxID=1552750 RepID=UPI002A3605C9|nr:hypothetical protein [Zoogloea oleivorans]MDY0037333.1 hypothetical protein [Zoogloea oleivorans]